MERHADKTSIFARDFSNAPRDLIQHIRRHPVPYALVGAGILGLIWGANRRQRSGVSTRTRAESDAYAPSEGFRGKRRKSEMRCDVEMSGEQRERKTAPGSLPHAKHERNGENEAQKSTTRSWVESQRLSFSRTRERWNHNRVELEKRYNDAFAVNPLRFGMMSAVIGALLGVLVPLSLRERNIWRPIGQRFWLQAQRWSEQELQKWDAAVDAQIESPPS